MVVALVIVFAPLSTVGRTQGQWPAFVSEIASISPEIGDQKHPSETTWLLSLPEDTLIFSGIVNRASSRSLQHRVLYFEKAPLEYSFLASPT